MRKHLSILAALLIVSFVAACGQKGPLRLPPAPAKPAAATAPAAPTAAPTTTPAAKQDQPK